MKIRHLFFALFFISPFAQASDNWDHARPYKSKCVNGSQQEMNICLHAEYVKLKSELDKNYKELVDSLEETQKIKRAQEAWESYVTLTCDYTSSGIDENSPLGYYSLDACKIDLTEKRIRDMKRYLSWHCNGCPTRK